MKIDLNKKYETVAREGYPSVPVRVADRFRQGSKYLYDVQTETSAIVCVVYGDGTCAELPIGPVIQEVKKSVAELIQEAIADPSKCSALRTADGRKVLLIGEFHAGAKPIGYVIRNSAGTDFMFEYVNRNGGHCTSSGKNLVASEW